MDFSHVTSLTIPEGSVKAIYCNDVKLWGTAGTYENTITGVPPLTLANCTGDDLVSWSMVGNTVQNGTPSPENPADVQGVGDWDETEQKYKIPVKTNDTTTNIYLNSPLMQGETLSSEGEREVEWGVLKLEPTLSWNYVSNGKGRFTHVINGAKPYDATVVTDARCTHIVADTSNKVYSSETLCFAIQYTGQIWISAAYFNRSLDDFKTWLTTNDVYLYYPLSTHTTETFTPPSIPTETGTTVLDTDCVVAPSEMTLTFMSTTPQNEETR